MGVPEIPRINMKRRTFLYGAAAMSAFPGVARPQQSSNDGAGPSFEIVDVGVSLPRDRAIVVGNNDYAHVESLDNAVSDARLMSDFLVEQGYLVHEYFDITKRAFERVLRRALYDLDPAGKIVFYFAGHGLQIGGANFLLPVDIGLQNPFDVPFEAVALSSVVRILGARARAQMVILDSCRDNPFRGATGVADLSGGARETGDGFGVLSAPVNTLVSFSTSPGQIAWDGAEGNSPYTVSLVETAAAAPDAPATEVFARVREAVAERTGGRQVPWDSSTMLEDISFRSAERLPPSLRARLGGGRRAQVQLRITDIEAGAPNALPSRIDLNARLEPQVNVGQGLLQGVAVDPQSTIRLATRPGNGSLMTLQPDDGRFFDPERIAMTGAQLENLVYRPDFDLVPTGLQDTVQVADRFTLTVDGRDMSVVLTLDADPCDVLAGDHLDPDGVGISRYPNEIPAQEALDACLVATRDNPDEGRFHYQTGRAHLALVDFENARAAFERARELGHTRALVALGRLIASEAETTGGRNRTLAPTAALDLFREGVERGDPYAFHALGVQYLYFGETEAQREEGFELLSRALELGHTFSMNALGVYFMNDNSEHADPARGLRYWQESAARDDIYGYSNLGVVHRDGLAGEDADPQKAFDWFRRAAEGGHPSAPGNIGRLWNSGALGAENQHAEAVRWYDIGLDRGDAWAGANGSWIVANRAVPGLGSRDAAVRAGKAAALNNTRAAASAREVLGGLDPVEIDAAAQMLINDLGGDVSVDGAFGPGTRAAFDRLLARNGASVALSDAPVDRLVDIARIYWTQNRFRVDLY